MGFLVPAVLGALVALGIPLWMHLRDRNEESPVRFPSLMFLVRLPIRSADRRRVTDIPLLVLRALVVALLVMAFARPFVGTPSEIATSDRARAVVLVLDRSLSMSHGSTWTAAQDSALRVLDGLSADDRVTVLLADEEAMTALEWTADVGAARAAVQGAVPLPRGTRFGAALRAARGALATAPPAAREVVFVTDLQRSGLGATAGLEWPDGVALRTIIAAPARRANASVSAVEVRRVPSANGARTTLSVQARIVAREFDAPRTVRATLAVAGRDVATRDIALPANGDRTVMFDGIPAPATAAAGLIRIDSDALPADDSLHFALGADAELRVLLLAPRDLRQDETLYLERALAIGRTPTVRVERRPLSTFDATMLERASVVLLWDAVPNGSTATALNAWVASGGGVVLHAAHRLGARRFTLLDAATADGLADRASSGGASIGETRADHALFLPFRAVGGALGAPRLWRYTRLTALPGSEIIARFDDGSPAILERSVGDGRVLVTTLALDVRDGDLPLQPAFLPLMRRMMAHVSAHANEPAWRATGDVWSPRAVRGTIVVTAPDGAVQRFEPNADVSAAVSLERPGVYAAYQDRVDGAPRALTAANAPTAESDLTMADARELLLGVGRVAEDARGDAAPATAIEVEGRQRMWRWLLIAVALLLVTETVVGAMGWRGRARRASVEAMDRLGGTA
jgi:hypothetical protein